MTTKNVVHKLEEGLIKSDGHPGVQCLKMRQVYIGNELKKDVKGGKRRKVKKNCCK